MSPAASLSSSCHFQRKSCPDHHPASCRSEESLTGNSSFSGSSTTPDNGQFDKFKILAGTNGKILSSAPKIEIHQVDDGVNVDDVDDDVFDGFSGVNGFGHLNIRKQQTLGNLIFLTHSKSI